MTNGVVNLGNRIIDEQGNVVYFSDALVELLYDGFIPSEILYPQDDPDVTAFNKYSYENIDDIYYTIPKSIKPLEERRNEWFYPQKYDEINLSEFFINLCKTVEEKDRVNLELQLFQEKGFEKFLRCCIWLSDIIKENNWVSGSRGSAASSYLLYLLKIHQVDSIKYDLDIHEFLK